jgi:hypothetical protein
MLELERRMERGRARCLSPHRVQQKLRGSSSTATGTGVGVLRAPKARL